MENTRLNLAVLLFPDLNENFTVVDDLDAPRTLPPFPEIETMAGRQNPELRVAQEALRQATQDVRIAQNALLPSLAIDGNYGIEANAFALHSRVAAFPQAGPMPNPGHYIVGNFTLPVFDWRIRPTKTRQAQPQEQQARVELPHAQRQVPGNRYWLY